HAEFGAVSNGNQKSDINTTITTTSLTTTTRISTTQAGTTIQTTTLETSTTTIISTTAISTTITLIKSEIKATTTTTAQSTTATTTSTTTTSSTTTTTTTPKPTTTTITTTKTTLPTTTTTTTTPPPTTTTTTTTTPPPTTTTTTTTTPPPTTTTTTTTTPPPTTTTTTTTTPPPTTTTTTTTTPPPSTTTTTTGPTTTTVDLGPDTPYPSCDTEGFLPGDGFGEIETNIGTFSNSTECLNGCINHFNHKIYNGATFNAGNGNCYCEANQVGTKLGGLDTTWKNCVYKGPKPPYQFEGCPNDWELGQGNSSLTDAALHYSMSSCYIRCMHTHANKLAHSGASYNYLLRSCKCVSGVQPLNSLSLWRTCYM
ncbi:salivary glue protein Sgs-3-like, partial [Clytia hemisphaerica]|uniref:salivary glue protein Sgs-3-like n=1 Tax=Clytia hemisphaerica TaxID=252671 RepID=UPI0034D42644